MSEGPRRRDYPSDVCDGGGPLDPYLTLMAGDAPQRGHSMRGVFNGLRWVVRAGVPWHMIPNDLPPRHAVRQQSVRWIAAGCFRAMAHDLRGPPRVALGGKPQPTAAIFDGRTLQFDGRTPQSTPEGGWRAGHGGARRRKGSNVHSVRVHSVRVHSAVDTLGHLLALHVTPASEQERARVAGLAARVQEAAERCVTPAFVDQDCAGDSPAVAASMALSVVRLPEAKGASCRRRVVERSCAWVARFRRLAGDCERLPATPAGLHYAVFAPLMPGNAARLLQSA